MYWGKSYWTVSISLVDTIPRISKFSLLHYHIMKSSFAQWWGSCAKNKVFIIANNRGYILR